MDTKNEICNCEEFRHAQQSTTNNEGYGRLVNFFRNKWEVGYGLLPISYCPWCGKRLTEIPNKLSETHCHICGGPDH